MYSRPICVKISHSPSLLLPGTNAGIFALLYPRLSHPSPFHPGLLDPNLSTNTVEPPAQKCSGDVEMEVKKPPEKDPEVLSDASSI